MTARNCVKMLLLALVAKVMLVPTTALAKDALKPQFELPGGTLPADQPIENTQVETSEIPTLGQLLANGPFAFRREDNGDYRVMVEGNGRVSIVVAYENEAGWTDGDGQPVKVIFMYTWIGDMPEGATATPELLAALSELNHQRLIGRVCLNSNGLYYASTIWLKTADVETLVDELIVAHNAVVNFKQRLLPIVESMAAPAAPIAE